MEDPIDMLIDAVVQHEVLQNWNKYLTLDTIINRVYKKMSQRTGVTFSQCEKTILFSQWHNEISPIYESLKPNMSHDERVSVDRVLGKDSPLPIELTKFACVWHKYDPVTVCRWFAVDGIIGTHPKAYVNDAFSTNFQKHNNAVRVLYDYFTNPETIKEIVEKAFAIREDEPCASDLDPEFERCVGLYAEMVDEDEMERVASDRRAKLLAQQQPNKRKRKNQPQTPQYFSPVSPTCPDSPQNV